MVRDRIARMLGEVWWAFMLRGVLAVALGLCVLIWPSASVALLMMLVGLYCLADGVTALVAVFRGGERDANLIQALVGLLAGAVLLFWPGGSVRALLIVFGIWVLFAGLGQLVAARRAALQGDDRSSMTTVGWLVAAVGLLLIVWPGTGVVAIGWLIAIAALVVGGLLIFVARRLKRAKERLETRRAAGSAG